MTNVYTDDSDYERKCERPSCHNKGEPDHTCPYAEDIGDDHETMCNCCSECQSQCADDI